MYCTFWLSSKTPSLFAEVALWSRLILQWDISIAVWWSGIPPLGMDCLFRDVESVGVFGLDTEFLEEWGWGTEQTVGQSTIPRTCRLYCRMQMKLPSPLNWTSSEIIYTPYLYRFSRHIGAPFVRSCNSYDRSNRDKKPSSWRGIKCFLHVCSTQ